MMEMVHMIHDATAACACVIEDQIHRIASCSIWHVGRIRDKRKANRAERTSN